MVEDYKFTSTNLKDSSTKDADGNIIKVKNDTARIAIALSSSSSYSTDSITAALKEAKIIENIHDQTFYDYMKENYSSLFD